MVLASVPMIDREIQSLLFPVPHDGVALDIRRDLPALYGWKLKRELILPSAKHQAADRILN